MNVILVINLIHKSTGEKITKEIRNISLKILKILDKNNVSVEIYLADARKMKFLNKKFRGKDKAASILSFEEPRGFISPPSKVKKIGEIYIKVPITDCSITQLICHSLLHLLGFKHNSKNDRIKMEKMEKFLIPACR